jgi:uncharacterized protein
VPAPIHPDDSSDLSTLDGVGITPEPEKDPEPLSATVEPERLESPIVDSAPIIRTDIPYLPVVDDRDVQLLFVRAYSLVSAALLVSAIVASLVSVPTDENVLQLPVGLQFLFLLQIGFVAVLARYVTRFPRAFAAFLLFFWAAVNGISFALFLHSIPSSAIAYGFFLSAISFAVTAAIASRRGVDLGSWRGIFLLFAVGFVLIPAITLPLRLAVEYWATAFAGFAIFACLAAFFSDDIRNLDLEFEDDRAGWKSAICGALILYLNFVNLYLIVMRLGSQLLSMNDSERPRRSRF